MPFKIEQQGDKYCVVDSETGELKGGPFNIEKEAQDQIDALAISSPTTVKADMAAVPKSVFVPIQKIVEQSDGSVDVYGWGAIEEPDQAGEIMDYETSAPFFNEWSAATSKRSGGKSLGNLRAMHQPIAAGKLIDFRSDPEMKGFYLGARVIDPNEARKVREGVYTGFSVGGSYKRRWPDQKKPGLWRYTAKPGEFSIVDAPCIPSATFQVVKGQNINKAEFHPSNGANKLVWEPDDEPLQKDTPLSANGAPAGIPSDPGTVGDFSFPNDLNPTVTVDRVVDPTNPMTINPNGVPTQEVLAAHSFQAKELKAAMAEILGQLPTMIKDAVNAALDARDPIQKDKPSPRMIPVKPPRFVKVITKENEHD
jgi:hypothetical protein